MGGPARRHGHEILSTLPKLLLQDGMQSILPIHLLLLNPVPPSRDVLSCQGGAASGSLQSPHHTLSHCDGASRQLANSLSLKSSGAKTSKGIGNKGSSWWKWVCGFPTQPRLVRNQECTDHTLHGLQKGIRYGDTEVKGVDRLKTGNR